MNGYICLWKSNQVEVKAASSFQAQGKALVEFKKIAGRKKVKQFDITVILAEENERQVVHSPDF